MVKALTFYPDSDPNVSNTAIEKVEVDVALMRLSNFINKVVGTRAIPMHLRSIFGDPKVVMKMDIEGSEVDVLPDLLSEGSFKFIDVIMVEFHEHLAKTDLRQSAGKLVRSLFDTFGELNKVLRDNNYPNHLTELIEVDDESYYTSSFPLPQNCDSKNKF